MNFAIICPRNITIVMPLAEINTQQKFARRKSEENIIEWHLRGTKEYQTHKLLTMLEKVPPNYLLKFEEEHDYTKKMDHGLGNIQKNRDRSPYYYFGL